MGRVNVKSTLALLSLSARAVHTSCDDNGDLSTTITGGQVGLGGFGPQLPVHPAPNTDISLPGGILSN